MRATTFKRGFLALVVALGVVITAMIVVHPVGEPWMWAVALVVYIPMLLVVVSVGLYIIKVALGRRRSR